jgi:hypothetical protein
MGSSFARLSSGADLLGRLLRYETAMERSFFQTSHELERIQRRRLGENIEAPRAVDVDLGVEINHVPEARQPSSQDSCELKDEAADPPEEAPDRAKIELAPALAGSEETAVPPDGESNAPTGEDFETKPPLPVETTVISAADVPAPSDAKASLQAVTPDPTRSLSPAKTNFETKPIVDPRRDRMEKLMFKGGL